LSSIEVRITAASDVGIGIGIGGCDRSAVQGAATAKEALEQSTALL
jgi:hypothetical protein